MLKIKVIVVGAIVFFTLILAAFFFLLPGVQSQSSSVMGSEESATAKADWADARPFSITNYMQRGDDLMLILRNESNADLVIIKTCISETKCQNREDSVKKGETVIRLIPVGEDCDLGEAFNYGADEIVFEYTENGEKKLQNGEAAITGTCT